MLTVEECMSRADELVQEVFNAFGGAIATASPTPEFSELMNKAFRYRNVIRMADNHREHGVLGEQVATEVESARRIFAEAYVAFLKNHPSLM